MNIAAGSEVEEIEVFEIVLNSKTLDENVLKQIDKQIPYHIIFVLRKDDNYQIWIGYKESSQGKDAFKVNKYFHSEWIKEESINLKFEGLNIDSVYENYIRQLGGERLKTNYNEGLKETIERDEKRIQLEKQIKLLQDKLRKEKQFNKQVEINKQIKVLEKEHEEM